MDRLEPFIKRMSVMLGMSIDEARYTVHQGIKRKSGLILDNIGIPFFILTRRLGCPIPEASEKDIIDAIVEINEEQQ
jgi:hypothetical protein